MNDRKINVEYMARVEGEAALDITVTDKSVTDLKLKVFEPARFFESFLIGRKLEEVPDLVARICGICPVSHMLTSIQALEDALEITPSEETLRLRKLLALSQWLQSHVLHTYMLALPDYYRFDSVIDMVPEKREIVKQALELKRLGNDLTTAIGGREVHPVTTVIGGFTNVPTKETVSELLKRFKAARKKALSIIEAAASLELPDFSRDIEYVSLSSQKEYPIIEGTLVSNHDLNISKNEYREHIIENHAAHSNALHSRIKGRSSFLVGPLSRVNLNSHQLSGETQKFIRDFGLDFPTLNPFASIPARAVETLHSIEGTIELLESLVLRADQVYFTPKAGFGAGIGEAPRGSLYHYYETDKSGTICKADIVTPTAHNAFNIEEDLRAFIPENLELDDEELAFQCEMLVRAYDPCFSCSAHALKINLNRKQES